MSLLASGLVISCGSQQPGAQAQGRDDSLTQADPSTVLVHGNMGVMEVTLTGEPVRRLLSAPVQAAVRHGEDVFAITGGQHEALGDEDDVITETALVRVSLRDGSAQRVALLDPVPGLDCEQAQVHLLPLTVQSAFDFRMNASGDALCVRRQDRNANMMDVAVHQRVWLADGRVESRVLQCGEPREEPFDCGALPRRPAPPPVRGHRVEEGHIVAPDGTRRPIAGGFEEEQSSPSGSWVLLSAVAEEGDYIHRALLLLDRRGGSVHPLGPSSDGAALTDAALADTASLLGGMTVPGEAFIRFVSWGGVEYLVADQFLVTPGGGTANLMGTPIL